MMNNSDTPPAHTHQRSLLHSSEFNGVKGEGAILMEACPITALGMRQVLIQSYGFTETITHVSRLSGVPALMRLHLPRLLIMELCGEAESVLDGLRLIAMCNEHWPLTSIVVCTALDDLRVLQLLAASGIKGLLLKKEPTLALAQCVEQVLAGEQSYSPKVRQLLAGHSLEGKALTTRELDVLAYLFSGKSVTTAALTMHRDVRTVSTHKRNAMAKLGFQNDGELFTQGTWMAKTGPVFVR